MNKYELSKKLLAEIKQSRFFESSLSDIFLLTNLGEEANQILKNEFDNDDLTTLMASLDRFIMPDHYQDPISVLQKTNLLELHDYENRKQLDEIAMGFVYSHDVNAAAYQGQHDEIAIAIDHSIFLIAERLFGIIANFFLTEPSEGKPERTKNLISEITHTYMVDREEPEMEDTFPKELKKVSSTCAWSMIVFCLFHEIGHVVKGHFLDCHNKSNDIRIIKLQPSQELEADEFALQEWLKIYTPSYIRENLIFSFGKFSKENVGFDPAPLKIPLMTFLPISVDIIFTVFQLLDRLTTYKPRSHPLWQARKDYIRNCVDRNLSKRQRGVLAAVEKLID